MTFRLMVPPLESPTGAVCDCELRDFDGNAWSIDGVQSPVQLEVTEDSWTYEATVTPRTAQPIYFAGTDAPRQGVARSVEVPVFEWHDAYAPFVG
jgi:hypothetical protein